MLDTSRKQDEDYWINKFITVQYIAWDETQANEIGRFDSYSDAKNAIKEYAKKLNEGCK